MRNLRLMIVVSGLAVMPVSTMAQSITELEALSPADRQAYMQSMSPEERSAMRGKWREEVAAMPEEERRAMRERMRAVRPDQARNRDEMRKRRESMSDEERAAARQQREQRMQERRQKWDSMSEQEREAMRQRFREHRKGRPGRRQGGEQEEE